MNEHEKQNQILKKEVERLTKENLEFRGMYMQKPADIGIVQFLDEGNGKNPIPLRVIMRISGMIYTYAPMERLEEENKTIPHMQEIRIDDFEKSLTITTASHKQLTLNNPRWKMVDLPKLDYSHIEPITPDEEEWERLGLIKKY